MRLSSLYCNLAAIFPRIDFKDGINVILGEIRVPENRKKDTHNLGKSTLGILIDYCLLRDRDRDELFMHQHEEVFKDFEFFLEFEQYNGGFVTIRRCVRAPTKISLVRHAIGRSDFTGLPDEGWDHTRIPLNTAKEVLDDMLSFSPSLGVREAISYSLRLQRDYVDVFRPLKWSRSADRQWKPVVMHFLGLDGKRTDKVYELTESVELLAKKARQLKAAARGGPNGRGAGKKKHDLDWLRGVLRERSLEQEAAEREMEQLQFAHHDARESEHLTRDIEQRIAELNQRRYSLQMSAQRIKASLAEQVAFDVEKLRSLYADAQIYLSEQLVRDYDQLLRFNREITEERNDYLKREAAEIDTELKDINANLELLDARRSEILQGLRTEDSVERYRSLREEIRRRHVEVSNLERRVAQFQEANEAEKELQENQEELAHATAALRAEIHASPAVYQRVQQLFSSLVRSVTDKGAVLSTQLNAKGNPEFSAEILSVAGDVTSEADGNTYRRLLCIAFDVAVLQARDGAGFVRWCFHDGLLETLDDRKKYLLVEALKATGLQQIITAIDSDLPDGPSIFADHEIVRLLHDAGDDGRLFRMPLW